MLQNIPPKLSSKLPLLSAFSQFLVDFTLCLPYLCEGKFQNTYICDYFEEDFYTFFYSADFFEKKFKGIIEIKTGKNIRIKIIQRENIYKELSLLPLGAQEIIIENLIKQIFKQGFKKIFSEKISSKNDFADYIKTSRFCGISQEEQDILQILLYFYLKNNGILSFRADDILKFKKTTKEKIEKTLALFEKNGIITIINNLNSSYFIMLNGQYFKGKIFELPSKLLNYNYKKRLWERKIGELLYFKKGNPIKIKELLNEIEAQLTSLRPVQIRTRLENALDYLQKDNIISSWEYKFIDEKKLEGRNWLLGYKNLSVTFKI